MECAEFFWCICLHHFANFVLGKSEFQVDELHITPLNSGSDQLNPLTWKGVSWTRARAQRSALGILVILGMIFLNFWDEFSGMIISS